MKKKLLFILVMLIFTFTLVGCGGGNKPPQETVKVDFNSLTVEYDGNVHSLELEGKLPSGVYVTYENNDHTEPGEYKVIVYFHGDYEKYGLPEKMEAILIINQKPSAAEVWFDSQNFEYDGKPHSIYISGYLPKDIDVKYENNEQVEPGQYLVTAYFMGDIEKYGLPEKLEAWMIIDKPNIDYHWSKKTVFQYDGTEHSIYIEGNIPDDVWIEYEGNEQVEPGEYLVIAYFKGNIEKYDLPEQSKAWMTIEKREDIEVSFNGQTFVYDGMPHSIYVEGKVPNDVWIKYEGNEQIEPGQYIVIAIFGGNYQAYGLPERLETWMSIEQQVNISVEFNSKMFEYDGAPHSIEIEGFIPADVVVRYEGNEQVEPGEYIVTAIFIGNYQAYGLPEKLEALLIIYGQTEAVDIYFDSRTFEYDGNSHSIYVEGNIPDDIWIEYIGNDQTEPGEYLVTAVLHGDYEKYGLPEKIEAWMNIISNNVLDISQVIFDSQTFTFDGNVHSLEATNLPDGAWVVYENNDQMWVGEYYVYATIYKEGYMPQRLVATLSIVERTQEYIDVKFEENTTFIYNGSEQSIYIDRTNVPDCIEVYYDGNGQVDAGKYFVYAYLSDPTGQYIVEECIRGEMVIEKAELDIKFETAIFDYNETYRTLSYEGELPQGLYITYKNNGKIYPGEYEVTAVINGYNKNYNYPETLTATLIITPGDYCNVKFYADYDEVHEEWVRSGSQIHSLPNVPYKEGYDGYWGYNNEGIYNDAYIYAIYVPRKYMIYYLVPGEEYNEIVKSEEVEYGQEISLYELEKTGYQFNGWTYNGEIFENTVFEFTEDLWLEAMIEKVKYTITYVDENDVVVKEDYAYYQDQITLPLAYTTSNNEEVYVLNWTFDETQVYSGGALLYFNYTENKVLKAQTLNKELNDLFTFELRGAYLTITDYTGNLKELEIPTHGIFEGTVYEIDTIAANAINSEVLEKLIVPARIYLDQGALGNVSSLTELEVALKDYKFLAYYFGADDYNGYDLVPSTLRKVTLTMYSGQTQSITNYAFYNISSLEEITIANSVYKIYDNAFEGCTSLKNIYIPSRVNEIRSEAFKGCTSLKEIVLPESLNAISARVFENCSSLENIVIPNNVTTISPYAFSGCTALASIEFGTSLNTIQRYAFENTGLINVIIPTTVTKFENFVFYNSDKLQTIEFKADLVNLYESTFNGCTSLETVVLPNNLQVIEMEVFKNCTSLKNISLPNTVTKIDKYAFYNCSSLHSINLPSSITELGNYAFYASGLKSIDLSPIDHLPIGIFKDCTLLENVEFGENVTAIYTQAFENCTSLSKVYIPDNVTLIDREAFLNCTGLKEIRLSNNLVEVSEKMLKGCSNLESLEINYNNITRGSQKYLGYIFGMEEYDNSIGLKVDSAMYPNPYYIPKSLKTIIINGENMNIDLHNQITIEKIVFNDSVKNINSTMKGCSSLKTVEMADSVETIINNAFAGCISLENLKLSNNLKTIGQYAFDSCKALKKVVLPDSLTVMSPELFRNCESLETVIIGKNIEEIQVNVFSGCKNLVSVQFKDESKLKTLGYNSFMYCERLEEITLPESVEKIGSYAFAYCYSLRTITLNNQITYIDYGAFEGANLQQVYYNGTVSDWAKVDFASNPMSISGCNVYFLNSYGKYHLPKEVVISTDVQRIGQNAFSGCDFTSITISEGVEEIASFAFFGLRNLQELRLPSTLVFTEESSFRDISYFFNVYYNGTPEEWARIDFRGDHSNPMQNNARIKMLNSKGEYDYVRSVVIPNDVTTISSSQFNNFTELESITLHENITTIESYALYNTKIKELELFNNTTVIKNNAMPKSLEKIYYKGNIEDWCKIDFANIEANPMYRAKEIYFYNDSTGYVLTNEIIIPNTITEIKQYQFVGKAIRHIILPETLLSINSNAICTDNIDYIVLPASLETVNSSAFYSYSAYAKLMVLGNTENWSDSYYSSHIAYNLASASNMIIINGVVYVVEGSTAKVVAADYDIQDINILQEITINGVKYPVTEIGQYAFYNIDFRSVNIPNSILKIGKQAFARSSYESFECSNIYIPKTVEIIEDEVFTGRTCVIFTDALSANSQWNSRWNYSSYDSIALYYLPVYYGCTNENLIEIDGIYYYINNDHAEVVSVENDVISVEIKSSITVNGNVYPVTHINSYSMASSKMIQEVILPSSITTIKKYAIFKNTNLNEISLSTSIQIIENSAFRAYSYNKLIIKIDDEFMPYGWDQNLGSYCVIMFSNNHYINGLYYEIVDSKEAAVIGYNREYKDITILSEIVIDGQNYPVTSIKKDAFYYSNIETITIPESVRSIGAFAFYNSYELREVNFIGNGLVEIYDQAFAYCYGITSIKLTSSLAYIGNSAFSHTSITEIVIPDSVTNLGQYAFNSCEKLETVVIGKGVSVIEKYAFANCKSLNSFTFTAGTKEFKSMAFELVTIIENVYFEGTVEDWCNILFGYSYSSPMIRSHFNIINERGTYQELTEILVPSSITELTEHQFSGFRYVTKFVLPEDITKISDNAFNGCISVKEFTIPSKVTDINGFGLQRLEKLYYSGTLEDWLNVTVRSTFNCANRVYFNNSQGSYYEVLDVVIPSSITSIGDYQFSKFENLRSVVMPNTVLSIGEYAFNDCFRLEEVVLSNSLTTVGLHAFENCFIIDDIIIPTTLTNIGKNTLTYNHISRLFYKGTEEMFKEVDFLDSYSLQYIDIYYYSESEPVVEGNFWCLDENNQIHIW